MCNVQMRSYVCICLYNKCEKLAHTLYFPMLERTRCGRGWLQPPIPDAISPLIDIELWDKDQTYRGNVLSPMVPELTSLGHILTTPGRVKVKKIAI